MKYSEEKQTTERISYSERGPYSKLVKLLQEISRKLKEMEHADQIQNDNPEHVAAVMGVKIVETACRTGKTEYSFEFEIKNPKPKNEINSFSASFNKNITNSFKSKMYLL